MTERRMQELLVEIIHGGCAGTSDSAVLASIQESATALLADTKLEQAGAYGRTIDRWWSGFYTDWRPPTKAETAGMSVGHITDLLTKAY